LSSAAGPTRRPADRPRAGSGTHVRREGRMRPAVCGAPSKHRKDTSGVRRGTVPLASGAGGRRRSSVGWLGRENGRPKKESESESGTDRLNSAQGPGAHRHTPARKDKGAPGGAPDRARHTHGMAWPAELRGRAAQPKAGDFFLLIPWGSVNFQGTGACRHRRDKPALQAGLWGAAGPNGARSGFCAGCRSPSRGWRRC